MAALAVAAGLRNLADERLSDDDCCRERAGGPCDPPPGLTDQFSLTYSRFRRALPGIFTGRVLRDTRTGVPTLTWTVRKRFPLRPRGHERNPDRIAELRMLLRV